MMSSTDSLYLRLGGEAILREFVDHLYDYMVMTPEVDHVRKMHSADLTHARDRLFMFLSGMLGGPALYMEAFGHPRLRRKHLQFEIGNKRTGSVVSLCAVCGRSTGYQRLS
jgi:hemoglobin